MIYGICSDGFILFESSAREDESLSERGFSSEEELFGSVGDTVSMSGAGGCISLKKVFSKGYFEGGGGRSESALIKCLLLCDTFGGSHMI